MITIDQQKKCFGTTIEDMTKAKPEYLDDAFYTTCILSDAQELLTRNTPEFNEVARQYINKAKYFCSEASNKLDPRNR